MQNIPSRVKFIHIILSSTAFSCPVLNFSNLHEKQLQWKSLKRITLGRTYSDPFNRMITLGVKTNWGLVNGLNLIPLTE